MEGSVPPLYKAADVWRGSVPLQNGSEVLLAGFGISNVEKYAGGGVLRKTHVPVADAAYGQTEVILDQSKGSGACYGDSGGPALIEVDGKPYFWGVASRGDSDCAHRTFYTRIAPYWEWLMQASTRLGG
jgi:secreted trypsin-like serine protease